MLPRVIQRMIQEDPKKALALGNLIVQLATDKLGDPLHPDDFMSDARKLANKHYIGKKLESFFIVMSDNQGRGVNVYVGEEGTPGACFIHKRQLIKVLIESNCQQAFIFHNHPSMQNEPSTEDIKLKEYIKPIANSIGIQLMFGIVIPSGVIMY